MNRGAFEREEIRLRPLTFRKRQTGIASLRHSGGLVRPAALVGIRWTFIDERASGAGGWQPSTDMEEDIYGSLGDAHAAQPGAGKETARRSRAKRHQNSVPVAPVAGEAPGVALDRNPGGSLSLTALTNAQPKRASRGMSSSGALSAIPDLPPLGAPTADSAPADLLSFSFAKLRRDREARLEAEVARCEESVQRGVDQQVTESIDRCYHGIHALRNEKATSRKASLRSLLVKGVREKASDLQKSRDLHDEMSSTGLGAASPSRPAKESLSRTLLNALKSGGAAGGSGSNPDASAAASILLASPTSSLRTKSSPAVPNAAQYTSGKNGAAGGGGIKSSAGSSSSIGGGGSSSNDGASSQQLRSSKTNPSLRGPDGKPPRPPPPAQATTRTSSSTSASSVSLTSPQRPKRAGMHTSASGSNLPDQPSRSLSARSNASASSATRSQSGLTKAERDANRELRRRTAERQAREQQLALERAGLDADAEMSRLELEIKAVEAEAAQLESEVSYTPEEIAHADELRSTRLNVERKAEKTAVEESLLIWKPTQMVRDLTGVMDDELSVLTGSGGTAIMESQQSQQAERKRVTADSALRRVDKNRQETTLQKMRAAIERANSTIAPRPKPPRPRPNYGSWYVDPSRWGAHEGGDEELKPAHVKAREALEAPLIETHPLTSTALRLSSTQLYAEFLRRNEFYMPAYLKDVPVREHMTVPRKAPQLGVIMPQDASSGGGGGGNAPAFRIVLPQGEAAEADLHPASKQQLLQTVGEESMESSLDETHDDEAMAAVEAALLARDNETAAPAGNDNDNGGGGGSEPAAQGEPDQSTPS